MTTGEFADLVFKMRTAQKKYFRTRSQSAMTESKSYEKEVGGTGTVLKNCRQ